MTTTALLIGSRDEIRDVANDPRIEQAEAALQRFQRTGAVRDASAYARSGYALVREVIQAQFPPEVWGTAIELAAVKLIDAGLVARIDQDAPGGGLIWSLAHEMRDLATSLGMKVEPVRAPRGQPGGRHRPRGAFAEYANTLAQEVFRVSRTMMALDEIQETMGLSSAETAALFGVTRQAVDQWRKNGVPLDRVAQVGRVRDVARVLYDELLPERIPQVVRTPARGLGGRTILDVLAGPDGASAVRAYLARLYSFEAR